MPVAIVGTPSVTTFSAVASGNANFPATVNAGELLTLDFSQSFDTGITTPSGWTSIGAVGDGFGGNRAASFYKIAAGTEGGTTLALTFGGSCDAVAIITRHSGFDSTTPINGTPTTNSGTTGSTTAITSPSVTTSVNNCLVRRFVGTRDSTGIAVPSGQTDGGTGTTGTTSANATNRVGYSTQSTAGATGTVTFVGTGNSREWVAVTYAIAPSPGPTITADPTDQTVNNGATATFSVTATGTAPITYQWQDNSSGSFANIGGATSSSYGPTASYAAQGRQYRCVVTDANGNATSAAATLRVAFNLSGTGPRSVPLLGHPFGAGSIESYIRGSASGGAPSHATSGALAAQAATIAGTADHRTLHPTSGALASQSATTAGSATHLTLHTTTGALSAQAATISGTAQHQHAATGALSAQAATVAGSAAHLTLHTTTGALSAQSATIAGTAAHTAAGVHIASGALQAGDASISGTADVPVRRQVLGGWAKFRRFERPDDEEDTKTPQPDDTPVVEVVGPKQRIRGRIRIADIAARLAEQQQADADALERQAVERARRKRRQQQEDELLLF